VRKYIIHNEYSDSGVEIHSFWLLILLSLQLYNNGGLPQRENRVIYVTFWALSIDDMKHPKKGVQ